ncbi:ABC-2 type transport system ATP-binding protein [Marinococcus luteus]|uniref:ABC-2 type transport system ATP-binding protein n=1 Tax=Marinococcus luteus TaxID=1122204 RepID=A0A1H2RGV7_9BACI|nr:ABC transporter ATP-binding protein [Marinococcus luteus]SDW18686.1 ABC-2 type transport system ATP-binding protein [Marinococcus luteus]
MELKLSHVSLVYGKEQALDDVSLQLHSPKVYALIGRNGSGKTSLLSLIANYRQHSSGQIMLNGEPLFENSRQTKHVQFLFQRNFDEYDESGEELLQTAEDFIASFDIEAARRIASRFGLDLSIPMKNQSTGRRSMFQAIRGLASRAPVTIFDEVYTGMDAPSREIFYEEILKEQESHPRLIIISTHLISEMEHLFDEVIMLDQGRVVLADDYESVVSKGITLTGELGLVDRFTANLHVVKSRELGGTKSVVIFQQMEESLLKEAEELGLEIGRVTLQDIFTSVTKGEDPNEGQ